MSSFPSSGLHSLFYLPDSLETHHRIDCGCAVVYAWFDDSACHAASGYGSIIACDENGAAAPISVTPATAAIVQATSAEDVPPSQPGPRQNRTRPRSGSGTSTSTGSYRSGKRPSFGE